MTDERDKEGDIVEVVCDCGDEHEALVLGEEGQLLEWTCPKRRRTETEPKRMSTAIKADPSMPENAMFMLPPNVVAAIETAENIEHAHQRGRASKEMVDATIRYAEGVIRVAAKERRIGVIRNIES